MGVRKVQLNFSQNECLNEILFFANIYLSLSTYLRTYLSTNTANPSYEDYVTVSVVLHYGRQSSESLRMGATGPGQ